MEKDFKRWSIKKEKLDNRINTPFVNERDIFWCSIGINVGDEENGKSDLFSRPVLVFKKFNQNLFWGIPLSTKNKDNIYYVQVKFKDNMSSVLISHLRLYDVKRLIFRIGKLHKSEFNKIIGSIINLIPRSSSEDLGGRLSVDLYNDNIMNEYLESNLNLDIASPNINRF
ncbi:type II toxin-antitoxin system PemK/MazF family toxin [Candidatus Parcubacteria bacterium]|nr:type II toxin-antitoxin system PemK/MazF family toxin [Candidatus Parcubacteria bacterium]